MNKQKFNWRQWASPVRFDGLAKKIIPYLIAIAIVSFLLGFYLGFVKAPVDAVQGESYRIIFLHVPVSWVAMIIYLAMAFWSAVYVVWQTKLSAILSQAMAPTGALMCLLSLITGALWGKPTWGTYWVWDARLSTMLLLFFLYLGFIALSQSIHNEKRRFFASSILALVGSVNVPIIYFSVVWWNTLHQGASVSFSRGVQMHPMMFYALLLMTIATWSYSIAITLIRTRTAIYPRLPR